MDSSKEIMLNSNFVALQHYLKCVRDEVEDGRYLGEYSNSKELKRSLRKFSNSCELGPEDKIYKWVVKGVSPILFALYNTCIIVVE
ncbi:MAG: hypothetical protein ACRD8Z_14535 [Nitrososphaeraceae archaeon]